MLVFCVRIDKTPSFTFPFPILITSDRRNPRNNMSSNANLALVLIGWNLRNCSTCSIVHV
ncbi:hypothetical protein [Candidatus Liberibacter solanacearum]|uniref:hypothetical protein n=1 Tax=Candidatus Liberibacter solanacearum TaxID=556287 RepID=UPI0013792E77|nr:hypothetical protein [Candidatus Liberibacter solanacearum]